MNIWSSFTSYHFKPLWLTFFGTQTCFWSPLIFILWIKTIKIHCFVFQKRFGKMWGYETWLSKPLPCVLSELQFVVIVDFIRGEVTPTWAVIPRLQEPVWEIVGVLRPIKLRSDSSEKSEDLWFHLVVVSILLAPSELPSERLSSLLDQLGLCFTAECFFASVWSWKRESKIINCKEIFWASELWKQYQMDFYVLCK